MVEDEIIPTEVFRVPSGSPSRCAWYVHGMMSCSQCVLQRNYHSTIKPVGLEKWEILAGCL